MQIAEYRPFLENLFEQLDKTDINVSKLALDHVAYQADSVATYEAVKAEFTNLAKLVHESIVHGRRVAIFKLHSPLTFMHYTIPAIEVIESKPGEQPPAGFQHAEFVADMPLEKFAEKYSITNWDKSSLNETQFAHLKLHFQNGLTVKFLKAPILELI